MGQSNSQTSSTMKGDVAGMTASQVRELRTLGYTMGDAAKFVTVLPTDTCVPPQ